MLDFLRTTAPSIAAVCVTIWVALALVRWLYVDRRQAKKLNLLVNASAVARQDALDAAQHLHDAVSSISEAMQDLDLPMPASESVKRPRADRSWTLTVSLDGALMAAQSSERALLIRMISEAAASGVVTETDAHTGITAVRMQVEKQHGSPPRRGRSGRGPTAGSSAPAAVGV